MHAINGHHAVKCTSTHTHTHRVGPHPYIMVFLVGSCSDIHHSVAGYPWMLVCVCGCAFVCIYMHTYIHTHIQCVCVCIHAHTCTHTHAHIQPRHQWPCNTWPGKKGGSQMAHKGPPSEKRPTCTDHPIQQLQAPITTECTYPWQNTISLQLPSGTVIGHMLIWGGLNDDKSYKLYIESGSCHCYLQWPLYCTCTMHLNWEDSCLSLACYVSEL